MSERVVQATARADTKVLDQAGGRVSAVLSTEARSRDGHIVRSSGWDLGEFLKHPVLVAAHDYRDLRAQIGEWEDVAVSEKHKRLEGVARYYIGQGNAQADWGFNLASHQRAAYSVGFIPDMTRAVELEAEGPFPAYEFRGQTLLEASQVIVPADPKALQMMVRSGIHLEPVVRDIVNEMLIEWGGSGEAEDAASQRIYERLRPLVLEDIAGFRQSALPPHATAKADEGADWDAGEEVREAEGQVQLRRMHAWVDTEADPEQKGSYKLPHHRASGEVVWRGVAAAMAALMGGRGGVDIPGDDKPGVHRHLARHYEQFEKEPPPLMRAGGVGRFNVRTEIERAVQETLREVLR